MYCSTVTSENGNVCEPKHDTTHLDNGRHEYTFTIADKRTWMMGAINKYTVTIAD